MWCTIDQNTIIGIAAHTITSKYKKELSQTLSNQMPFSWDTFSVCQLPVSETASGQTTTDVQVSIRSQTRPPDEVCEPSVRKCWTISASQDSDTKWTEHFGKPCQQRRPRFSLNSYILYEFVIEKSHYVHLRHIGTNVSFPNIAYSTRDFI